MGSRLGPAIPEHATLASPHFKLRASWIIHIGFNMWCPVNLGALAERALDRWTYLLTYTANGIAGSLASLAWYPTVVGAGASGAIFGLAGALLNWVEGPLTYETGDLPYASGTAGVAFYWNPANLPQCSANLERVANALNWYFAPD